MTARLALALVIAGAALAACAPRPPLPAQVAEESAAAPASGAPARTPGALECAPGDGDGIGGTGCPAAPGP
jgi:hypothetical protein